MSSPFPRQQHEGQWETGAYSVIGPKHTLKSWHVWDHSGEYDNIKTVQGSHIVGYQSASARSPYEQARRTKTIDDVNVGCPFALSPSPPPAHDLEPRGWDWCQHQRPRMHRRLARHMAGRVDEVGEHRAMRRRRERFRGRRQDKDRLSDTHRLGGTFELGDVVWEGGLFAVLVRA